MRLDTIFGSFRRVAVLAACGAALSAVPMRAQDAPPPPPAGQDNQGPPPHEGRRDPAEMQARHLKMMSKQLNLSPDQVSQIKAIDDDQMSQMQALRSDSST